MQKIDAYVRRERFPSAGNRVLRNLLGRKISFQKFPRPSFMIIHL